MGRPGRGCAPSSVLLHRRDPTVFVVTMARERRLARIDHFAVIRGQAMRVIGR